MLAERVDWVEFRSKDLMETSHRSESLIEMEISEALDSASMRVAQV